MVLRLLFVLLIALNIAVGAWLLLGQDDAHIRSATDPDIPSLHLLSERPAPPVSTPVAATTTVAPAPASTPPAPEVPAPA
ncbi:MAG TPA: SPOR domain-containing protein, partial [Dyella sp.]